MNQPTSMTDEVKMCCAIDCDRAAKWTSRAPVERVKKRFHVTHWCEFHAALLMPRNKSTVEWEEIKPIKRDYEI